MVELSAKFKKLVKGAKVAIDYEKSKIYIVDDFYDNGDSISFKVNDKSLTINVMKKYLCFISHDDHNKNIKIAINYPQATVGIVEDIEGKFLYLKILNTKVNKYYSNIIPIKQILGIKLYDFDEIEDII